MGALDPPGGRRLHRLAGLSEQRVELDADAGAVHRLELGEDERLGELREPRHHVGHGQSVGRGHRAASAGAAASGDALP